MRKTTIFLVAGEESGDLHGANLVLALRQQRPDIRFIGYGGTRMAVAGVELLEHCDDLAVMGFTEVIKNINFFSNLLTATVQRIEDLRPERVILIDYPGFNLRLARRLAPSKIPVTYFILPQVWAWKEQRVRTIARYTDQALCIFPFEEEWFRARGVAAQFVGHPFTEIEPAELDRNTFYKKHNLNPTRPLLVLFPGSRQQEIHRHWPVFLQAARELAAETAAGRALQIVVGRARGVDLGNIPDGVAVEADDPRLALRYGTAALVASGTATLEAAVFDIPAVVAYRLSFFSYWLARWLVRVKHIAMVNLIAGRRLVPELIQAEVNCANLKTAVRPLLTATGARQALLNGYQEVRATLGEPGAYHRAARLVLDKLES
ncbi:MAG: lipid-A-disaccharide synthase [Candidatus Neomarinimicrobiota bacterium]